MRRIHVLLAISVLLAVGAVALVFVQAIAAEPPLPRPLDLKGKGVGPGGPHPVLKPVAMVVDPNLFQVNKLAPIPFKPFTLEETRDPRRRRDKTTPASMITLRNGKQVTASEYLRQVNLVEEGLNKLGYSLRTPQKQPVRLVEARMPIPLLVLEQQWRKIVLTPRVNDIFVSRLGPRSAKLWAGRFLPAKLVPPPRPEAKTRRMRRDDSRGGDEGGPYPEPKEPPPPPPGSKGASWSKSLDFHYGTSSLFEAQVRAALYVQATDIPKRPHGASVQANADIGGSVLGRSLSILNGNAILSAPATGPKRVSSHFTVTEEDLLNFDQSFDTPTGSLVDTKTYDLLWMKSYSLTIIPWILSIDFDLAAGGHAGASYSLSVGSAMAEAKVSPFAGVRVFGGGSASALLGILHGNLVGEVQLVDFQGNLDASAKLDLPNLTLATKADVQLTVLKGSLKAEVGYDVWFTSGTYDWVLWDYPGRTWSATLWDQNLSIPLTEY